MKNILKFLGGGLFSNEVIIKKSKEQKIWFAIIIMIISLFVSITPVFSSILGTNGSDVINNSALQLDYSLQRFSHLYLKESNAPLKMQIVDGKLEMPAENSFATLEDKKVATLKNNEEISFIEIGDQTKVTLLVTYVNYNQEAEKDVYPTLSDKATDVFNHLVAFEDYKLKDVENTYEVHSMLMFFNESYSLRLYANNSTSVASIDGNNVTLEKTSNAASSLSGLYCYLNDSNKDLNAYDNSNPDAITTKWAAFFNETYAPLKQQSLLLNTSVYAGLNFIVIILLAFTIFVMTRFKSSSCGKQKFGYCFKMVVFASLCPSILCLLVGFMMPSFQSISFLMFAGLRAIFLSTRLTRPEDSLPKQKNN